jgi:cytochrome oxidase assembly protein ShyY1
MSSTFWVIARRPRWIGALLLCLAIAGGFAALGQWQLSRSVDTGHVVGAPDTETPVPLSSIAQPQSAVTQPQFGRRVTVTGALVPGDTVVLTNRDNGAGPGAWLVGHLRTDDGVSLVVALGWAPDADTASAARDSLETAGTEFADTEFVGRYLPSEAPTDSDVEAGEHSALSVADLINLWPDAQPVYGGYLVLDVPVSGLERIISPEPTREVSLNLLNVFYAIEWAVFAGFALYLWYRLVQDAVERERDGEPDQATVE